MIRRQVQRERFSTKRKVAVLRLGRRAQPRPDAGSRRWSAPGPDPLDHRGASLLGVSAGVGLAAVSGGAPGQ
jgi:hypothetical protein